MDLARKAATLTDRITRLVASRAGRALIGSFVIAVVARVLQLIMAILLGRQLGPAGYGTFTFALGVAILAGQLATLGWPALMARFMPKYLIDENWGKLRGLVRVGDLVVIASVGIASCILLLGSKATNLSIEISTGLALAALLSVPMGFRLLRRQQLAALNRGPQGLFCDELMAPLALVLVLLVAPISAVEPTFLVYVAGSVLGVALGTYILRRALPTQALSVNAQVDLRMWFTIALPMVLAVASRVILNRIDVVMIAPLSTIEQVGHYGAAFRITFLIGFIPQISSTIMWPMIARAHAKAEWSHLRHILKLFSALILVSSFALSILVFVFADTIIHYVYGREFLLAIPVLKTLAIAQFVAALSTVSTGVLLMTGREKVFGVINFGGVILNVALNFALIPQMQAEGSAIATLVTNLVLAVATGWVATRQALGGGK